MGLINYIKNTYHRNLLEKLLHKERNLIKGKILDIGSKNRRYDKLFEGEIIAIDIIPNPELNVIKGNITNLQFPSSEFDSIICLEVLEYLNPEDFKKAINEIGRVLKKGGTAIISIPFYYFDHGDNYRMTYRFILDYLSKLKKFKFKIVRFGNKYTTIYDSIRYRMIEKRRCFLKGMEMIPVILICYLIIKIFSLEKKSDFFYSGLFIVASKI